MLESANLFFSSYKLTELIFGVSAKKCVWS